MPWGHLCPAGTRSSDSRESGTSRMGVGALLSRAGVGGGARS